MAKRFFYVCAGMLMLALSFHLGVRAATAQAGASLWSANIMAHTAASLTGRTICGLSTGSSGGVVPFSMPPVPGTAAIADFEVTDSGFSGMALLEDGSVYEIGAGLPSWTLMGNACSGPVPAQRESWGQLKSRYAPNPGAAKPGADAR